ncbi:MAG: hypothetical protein ACRDAX_05440, partial [Propionibacteriaceae bacterium]
SDFYKINIFVQVTYPADIYLAIYSVVPTEFQNSRHTRQVGQVIHHSRRWVAGSGTIPVF